MVTDFHELDELKSTLEAVENREALSYVSAFEMKVRMAQFHLENLPEDIRGRIPERSHTEACIFQTKAAIDCVAEAVNQIYGLRIDPNYALSIEDLGGRGGSSLETQNAELREFVRSFLVEDWWVGFKHDLRDRITHKGLASHHFQLGLPGGDLRTRLIIRGRPSEREVREDLEFFLTQICDSAEEVFRLLLADTSWQNS